MITSHFISHDRQIFTSEKKTFNELQNRKLNSRIFKTGETGVWKSNQGCGSWTEYMGMVRLDRTLRDRPAILDRIFKNRSKKQTVCSKSDQLLLSYVNPSNLVTKSFLSNSLSLVSPSLQSLSLSLCLYLPKLKIIVLKKKI